MRNVTCYILFLCLMLFLAPLKAQTLRGRVADAQTGEPLPFATLRLGATGQGTVTEMNGSFSITGSGGLSFIEVSFLGYETRRLQVSGRDSFLVIKLIPVADSLHEVIFTPPYDKIRRILEQTIAARDRNNPDKYAWYRCHVYYKMAADVLPLDNRDAPAPGDSSTEDIFAVFRDRHVLMSETYSIRSWRRPDRMQEEVLASRLSGFKKSLFTAMVTDVLPFHGYHDFLTLNGRDYPNPLSPGYRARYDFNLTDEFMQGTDTVWVLSFRPRKKGGNGLKGTLYVNSAGYAIQSLLATAYDVGLGREIRLEQQYRQVSGRWFPGALNYILKWRQQFASRGSKDSGQGYIIQMKGYSKIDSVSFEQREDFRFDRTHTVKLQPGADEHGEDVWRHLRTEALDTADRNTYVFMDSVARKYRFVRYIPYLEKIVEGKLPIGPLDMDLKRVYSYNKYEKTRLGMGLQTNEKLLTWASAGGWIGYGFRDREWKYGGFAEFYADRYRDFVIRVSFDRDIRDPGRVQLHKDLDRNYLRSFLLRRVDQVESFRVSTTHRMGYWNLGISAAQETFWPQYPYTLAGEGPQLNSYTATEGSVNLRYAFGERRAPLFGKYYSTGTKYPVLYARLTLGNLGGTRETRQYVQLLAAAGWKKHFNRIGTESFRVMGGSSWSRQPLPLGKLFAGNGFRYDQASLYVFGGMLTMYPYDFYMDRFVNLYWKHDFDWRFYTRKASAPSLSLLANLLWGVLDNRQAHQGVSFSVPDEGYWETGMMINNVLRLSILDLYYLGFNLGYAYHWAPGRFDAGRNGRFVYGFGVDL